MLHALLVAALPLLPLDDGQDPVAIALTRFTAADAEAQARLVQAIRERIEASEHPGVRRLLDLRDRARRELKVRPYTAPTFLEQAKYAPTQSPRAFVDPASEDAGQQYDTMRPWESTPPYTAQRVRYSYADNVACETGYELLPEYYLNDFLLGLIPDVDLLTAWLEMTFDYDKDIDKLAQHFDKAYCDRIGNCYESITIYDAFASAMSIEMSDIDVIAYARNVLKDNSFTSPIPQNSRCAKLYADIRDGFLRYFRHRTLCEAAARIYVHPESWLRDDHEGLRRRLWYVFALDQSDPSKIARRLAKAKDRDALIEEIDRLIDKDKKFAEQEDGWAAARNADRWEVANITYAVLQENGFMPRR